MRKNSIHTYLLAAWAQESKANKAAAAKRKGEEKEFFKLRDEDNPNVYVTRLPLVVHVSRGLNLGARAQNSSSHSILPQCYIRISPSRSSTM